VAVVLVEQRDALAAALGEECVEKWLHGLRSISRATYRSVFKDWLLYVWKQISAGTLCFVFVPAASHVSVRALVSTILCKFTADLVQDRRLSDQA
jgi:hypothetical protein